MKKCAVSHSSVGLSGLTYHWVLDIHIASCLQTYGCSGWMCIPDQRISHHPLRLESTAVKLRATAYSPTAFGNIWPSIFIFFPFFDHTCVHSCHRSEYDPLQCDAQWHASNTLNGNKLAFCRISKAQSKARKATDVTFAFIG